jgi:hypothetical protein
MKHQRPATAQVIRHQRPASQTRNRNYTWLDWNDGNRELIQYKKNDIREVPVFLNINTHKPERLERILDKNITHFDDYMHNGVVSYSRKMKNDFFTLEKPKTKPCCDAVKIESALCSRELSIALKKKNSNLTKRQYANSQYAAFKIKRTKAWNQFNHRKDSDWKKLDKAIDKQKIMTDVI